jgi:SP family general alpha glucoside:H+ symporter-like MFS transporter
VLPECATPTRRWLVRHGRIDEAKKSLLRLTSARATADFDADETVALMQHTIRLENEVTAGSTYAECFRGVNRRRTEISCMAQFSQNLVSPLIYRE